MKKMCLGLSERRISCSTFDVLKYDDIAKRNTSLKAPTKVDKSEGMRHHVRTAASLVVLWRRLIGSYHSQRARGEPKTPRVELRRRCS